MIEALVACCVVLWCLVLLLGASAAVLSAVIGASAVVQRTVRTLVQRHRAPRVAPGGLRSTGRRLAGPQNRHQRRATSRDAVRAQAERVRERVSR